MKQIDILKVNQHLSLLGRTRSEIPFMFGLVGSDGLPFLYTDPKKLDTKKILELIKTAKDKRISKGKIKRREDGLLEFWAQDEMAARLLVDALSEGLMGQMPELERAMVQY
ncbi:MAG: hypothetical protein ACON4U_02215 [Myxococcota bacterium]